MYKKSVKETLVISEKGREFNRAGDHDACDRRRTNSTGGATEVKNNCNLPRDRGRVAKERAESLYEASKSQCQTTCAGTGCDRSTPRAPFSSEGKEAGPAATFYAVGEDGSKKNEKERSIKTQMRSKNKPSRNPERWQGKEQGNHGRLIFPIPEANPRPGKQEKGSLDSTERRSWRGEGYEKALEADATKHSETGATARATPP